MKLVQVVPSHRSTRYPVTPTVSVDAVQERLICEEEIEVAVRLVGAVGAVVSEGVALFTVIDIEDEVVVFPAASRAVAVTV